MSTAFIFDLDGTLVDSVYQHVLAWHEALESRRGLVGCTDLLKSCPEGGPCGARRVDVGFYGSSGASALNASAAAAPAAIAATM